MSNGSLSRKRSFRSPRAVLSLANNRNTKAIMFLVNISCDTIIGKINRVRASGQKRKSKFAWLNTFHFLLRDCTNISSFRCIVSSYKSIHSIYQIQIRPRPMSIGDWRNRLTYARSVDAIDRKISRVGWSSEATEGTRAISSRPRDKILKGLLSPAATGTAPFVQLISVRDFASRR